MSYDLEVRSRPPYGKGVPRETVAAFLLSLAGVVRVDPTSFGFDRVDSGVTFSIDIGHQTRDGDEPSTQSPEFVNYGVVMVPYPLLDKAGPVALEMAFQLAEELGWSVYDLQAERELARDSLPDALRVQKASGETARQVLERAAAKELTLGELFTQEMWNHRLLSIVGCAFLATVATGWLLFTFERPREDFDRYMPWGVSVGTVVLMWLKGLAQAVMRHRRLRHETTASGSPGNHGAA